MELFMKGFTAITLNQAVGFNAILPVLLVAVMGRYEWFFISKGIPAPVSLPQELLYITSGMSILFLVIVTILESVIDKAQWFDNLKHVTIDPIVSTLSSAGITYSVMAKSMTGETSSFMTGLPHSLSLIGNFGDGYFWVKMAVLIFQGIFITLAFLFIKTAFRWVISAIPDMGVSNILVSFLEDGIVIISVVLAFFSPILALLFTMFLAGTAVFVIYVLRKKANEREKAQIRNLSFVKVII